ncbi:GNAT family N-acetyltransferase [Candidatus Bipolaricaulota bacterium]
MTFNLKQYTSPADYWRAREFFRALRFSNPRPSGNWHVGDFDYWRWHWLENVVERTPHELRYWEADDGGIAAVLVQGDPGVCHPMATQDAVSEDLYREMLEIAESEFLTTWRDGRRVLFVWSNANDQSLNAVLVARGYEVSEGGHSTQHHGCQALPVAPAPAPVAAGYAIRSMGDVDELPARSLASWRSFHPEEPDEGADPTGGWYRNIQRAPLYRRDLDVVAASPDGDIAAFATCYFDDVSRTGAFVLVGAAPPHQRKGLGKAVMMETLRRLHHLGAVGAYVSWYEPVPGALYESVGFKDQEISRAWRKIV